MKLEYHKLLSTFAYNFDMRRYNVRRDSTLWEAEIAMLRLYEVRAELAVAKDILVRIIYGRFNWVSFGGLN